jgi:MSHA biogenesis protein MshP
MSSSRQRGFSLILVLFLLVVVSLLAVSMTRLDSGSSVAVSQEILSVRALFAAESGAQAMAMKVFPINSSSTCPGTLNLTYTANGLNGCTAMVTITCPAITAAGKTVYSVQSEGICNSGTQSARRKVQVGLRTL